MRSIDICLSERERVSKGIINVGLSCKVENGINIVFLEYVCHKITAANISLDEFEIGKILNLIEVLKAGAVIKLIINCDIVFRVLLTKKDGCMRSNESYGTIDEKR